MNCEVCGTELPHGALFCGECGRAVGTRTVTAVHPDSGMPVEATNDPASEATGDTPPRSGDTAIIEPLLRDQLPELESALPEPPAPADEPDVDGAEVDDFDEASEEAVEQDLPPEVVAEEEAEDQAEPEPEPGPETDAEAVAEPVVPPTSLSEPASVAAELPRRRPTGPDPSQPGRPDPFPWGDRGAAIFSDSDELEQTLIVPRRDSGERFVLQFSTGESVTVFGSGLLGRNPMPQPTEYFDQLVSITDPGKSVSKTHLEFGQEGGAFWVSDRFSGNGSAVREPESSPRRLVAGKRYRIVRGTRVDIGEQFFVVS